MGYSEFSHIGEAGRREGANRARILVQVVLAFAVLLSAGILASAAYAGAAYAGEISVWGGVTLISEDDAADGDIELNVLNLQGEQGDRIYLNVYDGREEIAHAYPHDLGADGQSGASVADTFSIRLSDGIDQGKLKAGSYKVEAYADHNGEELLCKGTVYGVWGRLVDNGADDGGAADASATNVLIGTRTVVEGAALNFNAPAMVYHDGDAYMLTSAAPDQQGKLLYYDYERASAEGDGAVDGVISFVDKEGSLLTTAQIPGIPAGGSKTQEIPAAIELDGAVYRTLSFTGAVTATNPGQTNFVVPCVIMSAADQAASGFYLARIQMVDEAGTVIASDSVDVKGDYVYAAPSTIYKYKDVDGISRAVTYQLLDDAVYELSAANDQALVENSQRTIRIRYAAQELGAAEVQVTFNRIDGRDNPDVAGRTLGTQRATVSEDAPSALPDERITVDGTAYQLAGAQASYEYRYGSGAIPVVNVYYVPQGYSAPGPYTVTVNYVNVATGRTITSQAYQSSADEPRIAIDSPSRFEDGGTTYVRLGGQDDAIDHNFYSRLQAYTVYYRDIDDDLSAGTVITRTRFVYNDVPGAANAAGAGQANQADGQAGTVSLNANGLYNVLDGDGNQTITNEAGVDSNTERIDDAENPLASGLDETQAAQAVENGNAGTAGVSPTALLVSLLVLALLAGMVLYWYRERSAYGRRR